MRQIQQYEAHDKYKAALATYEDQRGARDQAEAASVNEASLARRAADPAVLADGRAVFVARCASCHTEDGRGLIGPNLTDQFQLHGQSRLDIFNTVKKGVPRSVIYYYNWTGFYAGLNVGYGTGTSEWETFGLFLMHRSPHPRQSLRRPRIDPSTQDPGLPGRSRSYRR